MLSYGYWQRRFGGDRSVVGRTIQVDAETREIVGVMPRGFQMVDRDFDILVPLAFDRGHQILAGFSFNGIARLRPGVSMAQADADVARLIGVWMDSWTNGPGTNPHYYERWKIVPALRSLKQQVIGSVGQRAVGGDGDAGPGDADRVHERCEPVAGARGSAAAGTFDSGGAWGGPRRALRANCCWRA